MLFYPIPHAHAHHVLAAGKNPPGLNLAPVRQHLPHRLAEPVVACKRREESVTQPSIMRATGAGKGGGGIRQAPTPCPEEDTN
jgi:hypothetical protein